MGIHVSFDDGENWRPIQANLPINPVYDIKVKGNDLIAGTHGRSIWILDDLNVVRQIAESADGDGPRLFTPRRTYRLPGVDHAGRARCPARTTTNTALALHLRSL